MLKQKNILPTDSQFRSNNLGTKNSSIVTFVQSGAKLH